MRRSRLEALALLLVLAPCCAAPADEAPAVFSHEDWTSVLRRFVDDGGRVDYTGLAGKRGELDRYLLSVKRFGPESNPGMFPTRDEKLAYYLNAYNALVFEGVLSRGPEAESVWSGLVSGYAFFVGMPVTFDGRRSNLKKLEDDFVRGFGDPRIHAALNCASVGCPRLPQTAFEAATLEASLDAAMREFVNTELHCRVDTPARTVHLSKIFDWFAADFVGDVSGKERDRALIGYVNRYRTPGDAIPSDFRIRFPEYDKRINKQ